MKLCKVTIHLFVLENRNDWLVLFILTFEPVDKTI